jgi:hypothetical protein
MKIKFTFLGLSATLLSLIIMTGNANMFNNFLPLIYALMFFPIFSIFYSMSKLSSRILLFSLLNLAILLTFHIMAYQNNYVGALELSALVLIVYGAYILLPSIVIFYVSYLFYKYLENMRMATRH